jgi:hypothetical protein
MECPAFLWALAYEKGTLKVKHSVEYADSQSGNTQRSLSTAQTGLGFASRRLTRFGDQAGINDWPISILIPLVVIRIDRGVGWQIVRHHLPLDARMQQVHDGIYSLSHIHRTRPTTGFSFW